MQLHLAGIEGSGITAAALQSALGLPPWQDQSAGAGRSCGQHAEGSGRLCFAARRRCGVPVPCRRCRMERFAHLGAGRQRALQRRFRATGCGQRGNRAGCGAGRMARRRWRIEKAGWRRLLPRPFLHAWRDQAGAGELQAALHSSSDCARSIWARQSGQLQQNRIVAWMQGRMEFGPRALGNRSILASPQDPYSTENLNTFIKHREGFRKFAASVPAELAARVLRSRLQCAVSGDGGQGSAAVSRAISRARFWRDDLVRVHTVFKGRQSALLAVAARFR